MAIYNSVFISLVIAYQWKKSSKDFHKVYQIDSHMRELKHQTLFSGLTIDYGSQGEKNLHEFEQESIRYSNKLRVALSAFICMALYIGSLYFLRDRDIMSTLMAILPATYIGIFLSFSYWGLYVFGLFFGLLYFGLNAQIIYPFGYFVVLGVSGLFLINLQVLNNWYWQNLIGLRNSRAQFKLNLDLRSLAIPFILFSASFLTTDLFIEDEKSFLSQIAKLPSPNSSRINTEMKIAKNINQRLDSERETFTNPSQKSIDLQKKLSQLNTDLAALEKLPDINSQQLQKYMELLSRKEQVTSQLKALKNNSQKSELSHNLSSIPLPKNISKLPSQGMAQVFQHQNFKSSLEKNFPRFVSESKTKEALLKLDKLAEKTKSENSTLAMEAYSKHRKKILKEASQHQDNHQNFESQMKQHIMSLSSQVNKEELNKIQKEMSSLKNYSLTPKEYNEKKKDFLNKLEQASTKSSKDSAPVEETQSTIRQEIDYLHNKAFDINERKNQSKSYLKYLKFLAIVFAIFFILYLLNKFLKKDKLHELKEELSTEQKNKIHYLLKRIPRQFKNFEEEVDIKYKIFHEMAEVIFFPPETKAPPAMILARAKEITEDDKLSKLAKNIGLFFNAIHFGSKKEFSAKEKKIFKKSFQAAVVKIKKLL
tara:strand:- start:20818 stop:22770 length:1953 start_codon:yes stop_codon:yes gene_type:complete